VPLALLAAALLQLALLPVQSAISRRYETEADWTALRATHDADAARRLFVGFAHTGLSRPDPPEWKQLLLGDHPSLLDRAELAQAAARRRRP
jgi:STE24 endopeptidase